MSSVARVGIVIVTYRSAASCRRLLASLAELNYANFQVWVVDNASGDGSALQLRPGATDRHRLIASTVNLGFAGGMNLGIRAALEDGCAFVWCLAHDLTVEPTSLSTLVELWPRLERPGFLGTLTDFNQLDQLYFYKGTIASDGTTRHPGEGQPISSIPGLDQEFGTTEFVNGAAIFTARDVIAQVGLMPEEYFLYFEDVEWTASAVRHGLRNYVSYRTRIHHHRPSSATPNYIAEYYCRRNRYHFRQKMGLVNRFTHLMELWRVWRHMLRIKFRAALGLATDDQRRLCKVLDWVAEDLRQKRIGRSDRDFGKI